MKYTLATLLVSGLVYWFQSTRNNKKEPDPEIGGQEGDTLDEEGAWMAVALETLFGSTETPSTDDGADQKQKNVVIPDDGADQKQKNLVISPKYYFLIAPIVGFVEHYDDCVSRAGEILKPILGYIWPD